jgi:hypothetical protein
MLRLLALVLAFVALAGFVATPALAADRVDTHLSTFVKAEANKLTVKDRDDKEHVYDLANNPAVTSDGKAVKVTDLKAGQKVVLAFDNNRQVNKIEAGDFHEGTFVKAEDNKLFMKGLDNKDHMHEMIPNTPVTCDGKSCKAGDLKAGTVIVVALGTDRKVNRIEGFTK